MKKTKIVCTIGPSSSSFEVMKDMIRAGMNVARLNMSHGDHKTHKENITKLRKASKEVGKEIAILMDLQGPKIRVEKLKINGELTTLSLIKGDEWFIGKTNLKGHKNFIPTSYGKIFDDVKVGHRVLFDDGLIEAIVIGKENKGRYVKIKVSFGGVLKSNKGINLPDSNVSAPSLTLKDKEDLMFGLNEDIDFVALSFVRTKGDIEKVRKIIKSKGKDLPIISKVEKPEAYQNIEDIVRVSDGVMIARGDMAVEVGAHLVPTIQKKIIILCNKASKPVITATQMLESMTNNMTPTRAEASDVANAVWDGTDAVMLSGETASGINPVNVIQTMEKFILEAETLPKKHKNIPSLLGSFTSNIHYAGSVVAENVGAKAMISVTEKGASSQRLSSFRPKVPIFAITNNLRTLRKFCLMWGVSGLLTTKKELTGINLDKSIISKIKNNLGLKSGDYVVYFRGAGKEHHRSDLNYIKIEQI